MVPVAIDQDLQCFLPLLQSRWGEQLVSVFFSNGENTL